MALVHVFNTVDNRRTGIPMTGIAVRAFNSVTNSQIEIFADENGTLFPTPNECVTDADGMYSFYMENETVTLRFYQAGALLKEIRNFNPTGPEGPAGPANSSYATTADLEASNVANLSAILAEAGKAGTFTIRAYADFASQVSADTGKINFIRSISDATKVWVRDTILSEAAGRIGTSLGQTVDDALQARPTSVLLATTGGAALVGTTGGGTVQSDLNARPTSAALLAGNASALGYLATSTDAVQRTLRDAMSDRVSVRDFGAVGDGATDDTAAFQKAQATGKVVFVPAGIYRVNLVCGPNMTMVGEGTNSTVLEPADIAKAAVRITGTGAVAWAYALSFQNILFRGRGSPFGGIGVSFGHENPADYVAGDQLAQPGVFRNCRFVLFDKGVNCSAGNIGIEFYSCNFAGNHYGLYSLDARFGSIMHAGCKYFYGGEFSTNLVGAYFENDTGGFGAVAFNSTIFEFNSIAVYVRTSDVLQPIMFTDCWNEGNGALHSATPVTVDQWSGTTKSTIAQAPRAFIFDGTYGEYVFNGGVMSDILVKGSDITVKGLNARMELDAAYGGEPATISGARSSITLTEGSTRGGVRTGYGVICQTAPANLFYTGATNRSNTRGFNMPARASKLAASGIPGFTYDCTTLLTTPTGLTNTITTVSDGRIFGTCNNIAITYTAPGQQVGYGALSFGVTADKFYAITFDLKNITGDVEFFIGDFSLNQFLDGTRGRAGQWDTIACICKAATTTTLGISTASRAGIACEFRLSAIQARQFDTLEDAKAFLNSRAYVV